MYQYRATIDRVIDGDTVDVRVDLGFHVGLKVRTRLFGLDAPEVSTPEGRVSRDRLRERLPAGAEVRIETFKAAGDKYGRWLATIWLDGASVNEWLVVEGLAGLYGG